MRALTLRSTLRARGQPKKDWEQLDNLVPYQSLGQLFPVKGLRHPLVIKDTPRYSVQAAAIAFMGSEAALRVGPNIADTEPYSPCLARYPEGTTLPALSVLWVNSLQARSGSLTRSRYMERGFGSPVVCAITVTSLQLAQLWVRTHFRGHLS